MLCCIGVVQWKINQQNSFEITKCTYLEKENLFRELVGKIESSFVFHCRALLLSLDDASVLRVWDSDCRVVERHQRKLCAGMCARCFACLLFCLCHNFGWSMCHPRSIFLPLCGSSLLSVSLPLSATFFSVLPAAVLTDRMFSDFCQNCDALEAFYLLTKKLHLVETKQLRNFNWGCCSSSKPCLVHLYRTGKQLRILPFVFVLPSPFAILSKVERTACWISWLIQRVSGINATWLLA